MLSNLRPTARTACCTGNRVLQIWLVLILASTLPACSVLDVINAFTPDSTSSRQAGVAYGDHPRQQLDVYSPLTPVDDAVVIIFFYGGGWDSGNRANYEFVARKLADTGHFVVVPDYRLYPEVTFPQFVEDGALATAHVLANLGEIADKSRPVFLMGHSAGAHIAMLVTMDQRYLDHLGQGIDEIAGVIGLAGPYDFLPITSSHLQKIFPTPQVIYDSQPINFVAPNVPPVFLAHGDRDTRVLLKNSVNMAKRLTDVGGDVTLKVYEGVTHAGVMKPFIPFAKDKIGMLDDILEFISTNQTDNQLQVSSYPLLQDPE